SIQVLDFTRQKQQRLQKLPTLNAALVMGNPKMPSTELQPLPGSETEARAIASAYRVPALTGSDASETNFKQLAEGQSVIHLATHGLVNQREVLASSIALSKDDKNDGFLTAAEVFELRLNAQLVVLSACETGLGALTGDGVVGLSRAFISAGAPSVLVSLWPVEDQTTARVMEAFHRRWSGVPLATALREAMLEMKNQGLGPAQWAAFSLIGEAGTIQERKQ
ncbi:MAG: CHAT domain-containing protein, partial [Gemmatimonadaceae bacterium]|nr:CHAT domain-containing protein [Gloeobacterales cyanobacterium ES-bin-141]